MLVPEKLTYECREQGNFPPNVCSAVTQRVLVLRRCYTRCVLADEIAGRQQCEGMRYLTVCLNYAKE
jgi:hypothetical protein